MGRLVRLRQRDDLPEGYRAFAWPLENGTVIVYVSKRLNALQRNLAVRKALRAAGFPRRRLALVPLVGLLPSTGRRRARLAAYSLAAAATTAGIITALGPHGTSPPGTIAQRPPHGQPPLGQAHRHHGKVRVAPSPPRQRPSPVSYVLPSVRQRSGSGLGSPNPQPGPGRTTVDSVPSAQPSTPVPVSTPSSSPSPTAVSPSPTPGRSGDGPDCVLRLRLGQLVRVCV